MGERYTVGSLFSGIGGLDRGFEMTGAFEVRWFCEADPFCQRVLAKHWPGVPCYEDVRELHGLADAEIGSQLPADQASAIGGCHPRKDVGRGSHATPLSVSVLVGGFPCQDVSHAGKRAGLDGARSGLWWEYWRLIGELRPRVAVMENVAGLFTSGIDAVLGSLAEIGYDAEWATLRASDVGAPHRRERVFIIAYPVDNALCAGQGNAGEGDAGRGKQGGGAGDGRAAAGAGREGLADPTESRPQGHLAEGGEGAVHGWPAGSTRWPARPGEAQYEWEPPRVIASAGRRKLADAGRDGGAGRGTTGDMAEAASRAQGETCQRERMWDSAGDGGEVERADAPARRAEPALGGVPDGLPPGLPRWRRAALQALGNAVVPQVAEIVAWRVRTILESA